MAPQLLEKEQKNMSSGTRIYEKRYFPRWKVHKRVELRERGSNVFLSYTRDLSLAGTSIYVFGNPPARGRVQLRVHIDDDANFLVQGRIAWRKEEPTHQLFGIVFENLSKNAHELIMGHAFESRDGRLFLNG